MQGSSRGTIYLVDASIYIFRAWFSLPDTLTSTEGKPVNAVYGFLRFVTEFLENTKPSHIVFAFDSSLTTSFRNEIFPEYKSNRESPPPELKEQFEICQAMLRALGIPNLTHEKYEADDLIATVACNMRKRNFQNAIVTSDKDLAQIVEGEDIWWNYPKDERLNADGVYERFGVWPNQIRDYLALVGDSVDNIPGVPGVGAKSAARLLRLYPNLDLIYKNLTQVRQLAIRGAGKIATNLKQHSEQAFTARDLTTLVNDIPLSDSAEYRIQSADKAELDRLVKLIGRGDGYVDRIRQVLKNW